MRSRSPMASATVDQVTDGLGSMGLASPPASPNGPIPRPDSAVATAASVAKPQPPVNIPLASVPAAAQHESPSPSPPKAVPQPPAAASYGRYSIPLAQIKAFRAEPPILFEKKTFTGAEPKRLLFIGDIHGCLKEFNRLLNKLGFKQDEDQVILVGDLVAKGPESVGVIRRARQINAWCVRGNHDDQVIRWREFLEGPGESLSQGELKALERVRGLPYADFKLSKPHYQIARKMSPADFAYLKAFPTIMALPPPFSEWVVVHGGLDPSKPLLQQDSHDVMNMRNIDSSGPTSSRENGLAWFEMWSAKMKILSHANSTSLVSSAAKPADIDFSNVNLNKIVYGHDAGRDLQLHPFTKGLDTRCVYGGKLSAFVLPGEHIVSVNCPNYDAASSQADNKGAAKNQRRRKVVAASIDAKLQRQQQYAEPQKMLGRRMYHRKSNSGRQIGADAPVNDSLGAAADRLFKPSNKQKRNQNSYPRALVDDTPVAAHVEVSPSGSDARPASDKGKQPGRRTRNRNRANSAA